MYDVYCLEHINLASHRRKLIETKDSKVLELIVDLNHSFDHRKIEYVSKKITLESPGSIVWVIITLLFNYFIQCSELYYLAIKIPMMAWNSKGNC